jgi:hypothetical protein
MRKSKALAVIRKRKRNAGLAYNPNKGEHPLIIALKAATAYVQATILLMKAIAEAEYPDTVADYFEKSGLTKRHMEAGEEIKAAIRQISDKLYPSLPEPPPVTAENI